VSASTIDLSKLPPPAFVEALSFESILAEMLADYAERNPEYTSIVESDPAYKVLEVAAYRELLLRQRINEEGKALLIAFAVGTDLDHIGITYYDGEERLVVTPADPDASPPVDLVMEDDESYRRRLLLKDDSYSTAGSDNAYKFHALSADGQVKDVSVTSPKPGTTLITVIGRSGDGTPSAATLEKVRVRLNSDDVRPQSEEVLVRAGEIIYWVLDADIYTYGGPDQSIVLQAAQDRFESYKAQHQMLGHDVTDSALSAALHVPGVFKVVRRSPINEVVCDDHQASWCEAAHIRIAGTGQ
jgi:phage-related baseplate assembly protein